MRKGRERGLVMEDEQAMQESAYLSFPLLSFCLYVLDLVSGCPAPRQSKQKAFGGIKADQCRLLNLANKETEAWNDEEAESWDSSPWTLTVKPSSPTVQVVI